MQAGRQVGRQAGRQAGMQGGRHARTQARTHTCRKQVRTQARRHAGRQARRQGIVQFARDGRATQAVLNCHTHSEDTTFKLSTLLLLYDRMHALGDTRSPGYLNSHADIHKKNAHTV